MNDFLIDLGVSAILTSLRNIKGEKKKAQRDEWKAKLKPVLLKVIKVAREVYQGDEDFA